MKEQTSPCGVLLLDKPAGLTSFDAVARVRRLFCTRKVGHTGTLDPMATGLLVVLVGRAAKAAEYLSHQSKHYAAELKLGLTSDTEDIWGKCTPTGLSLPSPALVEAACNSFKGEIMQRPPMYSALKVGGKKLVDLARKGVEVEREARPITIYQLDVAKTEREDCYTLSVECSGGTYIRTLCADIGKALSCGGVMSALRRTELAGFSLSDAHTLEELEGMEETARSALLLPLESLFENLPKVLLSPFFARLARAGCEIYLKKINADFPIGTRLRLCDEQGFFALAEVRDFEAGAAAKPLKQFDIE